VPRGFVQPARRAGPRTSTSNLDARDARKADHRRQGGTGWLGRQAVRRLSIMARTQKVRAATFGLSRSRRSTA
jgi:hypothetical protein